MSPEDLVLPLLAASGAAADPPPVEPTTDQEPDDLAHWPPFDGAWPPLPKYRPDLSLGHNREARRARPTYRQRGIGVTRSKRNPRR